MNARYEVFPMGNGYKVEKLHYTAYGWRTVEEKMMTLAEIESVAHISDDARTHLAHGYSCYLIAK